MGAASGRMASMVPGASADTGAAWSLDQRFAHGGGWRVIAHEVTIAIPFMRHIRERFCSNIAP